MEEFKCRGGIGSIAAVTIYNANDFKIVNGITKFKRKYGKFDRKPLYHKDWREPEVIGLA